MKIVEIRERTIPISSPIRNAYISQCQHLFTQFDDGQGGGKHAWWPAVLLLAALLAATVFLPG